MLRRLIPLCILLVLAACATTPVIGPAPGEPGGGGGLFGPPPPRAAWDGVPQGREWTGAARAAIEAAGPGLTSAPPKDIDAYCPRFAVADAAARRDFWVVMLSQVAQIESGLDPAKASPSGARGLLQISPDAARRYGCAIASTEALFDPAQNLACGAKILAATSGQDGYVTGYDQGWRGASRYWLQLRKPETMADIQSVLNAQTFCARGSS